MQRQLQAFILALFLLLIFPAHTQLCPLANSPSNSDLLQSGNSIISNSYVNTPAKREHAFTFTINFSAPNGITVAASASAFQVSSANGLDFAIWAGQGATPATGVIFLLINEDNSWSNIRVSYVASGRSDFFLGSFLAGVYLKQRQSQSTAISWNQAITGWTASQKNYNIIVELAGVKVASPTYTISFTGVSFNSVTGTITTSINLSSSPSVESLIITYIVFQKLSPISFTPFNVNSGSSSPYQFLGIDQIISGSSTIVGYAFNSAASVTGVTCIGSGCPTACVSPQTCQFYAGTSFGSTCLICGLGQVAINGQCVTQNNCGTYQYYNGTSCVCLANYVLISNICYTSCGLNAYLNNSQCSCLPGYTYSSATNQCVFQSAVICGTNFIAVSNKCICPTGFGILNNQCVICPTNSYVDQNGNCICNQAYSLNSNTNRCQLACFANAYRNSQGQCVCINGYYNQGNLCVPQGVCQNSYIWNGTNCTCPIGMVVDIITNTCTYCNTPNRTVSNGQCVCSPTYYPTSTGCGQCIPNSVYNQNVQVCLCITNYILSNGQCVLAINCPTNSSWNAALLQCVCNFANQYLVNGFCQSCQQNSFWNGSACVCNPGFVSSGSSCIQTCASNSFWNGNTCQCNSGFYIIGGTCQLCDVNSIYSNTQFTCVCNNGYFGTWNQCSRCDSSCATCSGPGTSQCLTCPSSLNLVNGNCRTTCSAGTYVNNLNQCLPCDSSCAACSGPGNNLCTSCRTGFTLTNGYCTASGASGFSSAISLRGYVLGNKQIYQGVSMSLLPTGILSAGCTICNNLFTVTTNSQFATITTTQQYVSNTQYWFLITFDFTAASSVPTFEFTIKINPVQASFFTAADMTQLLNGSFSQSLFNAQNVATVAKSGTFNLLSNLAPTSVLAPQVIQSIFSTTFDQQKNAN